MLGMFLSAYQKYCKNLKFSIQEGNDVEESNGNTNNILKYLGIDNKLLKNK